MIVALGEVQTKELIEDLIVIAKGNNELHEKNPVYGKLMHGDGWGIAYLIDKKWQVYKSLNPIYEDEKIHELENVKAKAIVLHVRKATKGEKILANTQPFSYSTEKGDFIFAGKNFGCGSSREQPALGLKAVGIRAVVAESFSRIFFRASINQGLLLIESPEAVRSYSAGDEVDVDPVEGKIYVGDKTFSFPKLPPEMLEIIEAGGLLAYTKKKLETRKN